MNLILKTEYWDDLKARNAFKAFMMQIHGLDFTAWEKAGYWDDAYTPFTFFHKDTVIANVCIYLLKAVVGGRKTHLVQISGVGTLPEWRKKGWNRQLTQIGLEWAHGKHEGVFLFADEPAIPFYKKCGFTALDEFIKIAKPTHVAFKKGAVKLDCRKKVVLDRIFAFAKKRTPVSDKFSILNERLLMFHVLYNFQDCTYEIPDLNCIVFYRRTGGCLKIFDILAPKLPDWTELYSYISNTADQQIELHFHTDKLGPPDTTYKLIKGNNCFVKSPFTMHNPVFPYTSRA